MQAAESCGPRETVTGVVGRRHCPSLRLSGGRTTHAHCLEAGAPWGAGWAWNHQQAKPPPVSQEVQCGPHTLDHTLAHRSASRGPLLHPLLLFHLPNYQAEVAIWFALFLYVK